MEPEKRKPTGREKDEEAIQLLEKLQGQLYSTDASSRRCAAYHLSWLQEDGLDVLRNTLFGHGHITTKNAASYGLRKMRGRMKKMAREVLREGLKHTDKSTKDVSRHALKLLGEKVPGSVRSHRRNSRKTPIKEISHLKRSRGHIGTRRLRG